MPVPDPRRPRVLAVLVAVAALLLTGCTGADGPAFTVPDLGPARVDVDTPALRSAKAAAGIEDCPRAAGRPGSGDLPVVTLPCLGGGRSVDLSTLRGPLVLSVWAQSCGPCREEMPVLQAFHTEHGDRVPVLGLDFQDVRADQALDFVDDRGATYPQLADVGGEVREAGMFPGRPGLPLLVILDEDGSYAFRGLQVVESPAELEGLVAEHLGLVL